MKGKKIAYTNEDGKVILINPSTKSSLSIEKIAELSVPNGLPFIIIDEIDVPDDFELQDRWFINEGKIEVRPKSIDELFAEEMDNLNSDYADNVKLAVDKVSAALAWDGAEETTKVTNARAELAQLRANYETDSTSIITKYYGE